ncbi:rab9 effector protein with kelch motifs [Triplophysa dalaica]|uniref:rab9 effector protein with kelch motifs n=1 Tax=Triplophysa dalaica TaxID=1582913 RepID=UPI0024DFA72F|nr:rab9 effector protein with kelch motifs [Triplophysa dalaica]
MGKVNFYAIWSLREAPRQFIRNVNRMMYQVQMPLPLPKQLIVFGLGEWSCFSSDTDISVEVQLGPEVKSQIIGTLSPHSRCLIWHGVWTSELLAEATQRGRRGVYAKVVLSIGGQVKNSFISSTPRVTRKRLVLNHSSHPSSTLSSGESHDITQRSPPEGSVSCVELEKSKVEMQDYTRTNVQGLWPMDKTPRRTVIGIKGYIWSSGELESPPDSRRISSPIKRKLCKMPAVDFEETAVKHVKSCRADRPSKRWSHAMCLSDPDTAILIGGEADDQASCKDSLWKLEIDSEFWFPMNTSTSEVNPPSSRGHSATFDPESKVVYVYGGMRDDQRYSDIYVLDTITWKWKLITAKGNIPSLAYHSANVYKRELYVFGGVLPSLCSEGKICSNALYIFNPEHGLWYQPIVEGDRPLPRFGHTTTLLSDKLIIFGGRKTAAYLNDLHILDLGFMEYNAVKYENMPPLARGFHAALPVSDNRVLISGGCSAIGVLQDLHLLNTDTNSWTSLVSPWLCSKPRAGHSLISLGCTMPLPSDQKKARDRHHIGLSQQCTILVFGGSDCSGTIYNDTFKCTVELPI